MTQQLSDGQDSFLDIVANLVGILIILVVIVGAQARHQLQTNDSQQASAELEQLEQRHDKAAQRARTLELDRIELETEIQQQNELAAELTERRHAILLELERTRRQLAEAKQEQEIRLASADEAIRESQQQRATLLTEIQQMEQAMEEASGDLQALAAQPPSNVETLHHYPNPIAKTVFAEEIHFRLSEGRLSHVPLEELIELMKSEWRVKAEKLSQAERTRETIGPIDGFRLQYQLEARMVDVPTELGPQQRRSVEFVRFQILPQPGVHGEPVTDALQEGSQFRQRLATMQPERTTVSIWVYPDGFDDHRRVKDWLHSAGFQMASWPLDFGKQISGGPQGFKTSAQ